MDDKEAFAIRAIFNAMFAVGVTARNVEEAEQAIDLAAKMLSYAFKRNVTPEELREKMLLLMEENEGGTVH
jgi:thiamine monophosphate synthase